MTMQLHEITLRIYVDHRENVQFSQQEVTE